MRPVIVLFAALAFVITALPIPTPKAQETEPTTFWQTRCAGTSRTAETLACEATQSLRVKESGQLLFKIDILYPGNNSGPMLQMQAPLGFYLPGKIKLSVDGAAISELSINTCDQRGCFIRSAASNDMIDAMKRGAKLEIDFAPSASQRQKVEVPLKGFSRAMDAIQQ